MLLSQARDFSSQPMSVGEALKKSGAGAKRAAEALRASFNFPRSSLLSCLLATASYIKMAAFVAIQST